MRQIIATFGVIASLSGLAACAQSDETGSALDVRVVAEYPHDPSAFTQGLVVHDGRLYESTGQYGRSSLRRVAIESGTIERLAPLDAIFFAEGLTILDGRIYQLTWQNGLGFVYSIDDFSLIGTFRYSGEGWGLTHDGSNLILSDGTATLRFFDPQTFELVKSVLVQDQGRPVPRLNELEYVEGEVWANIWYDDRIARIDPDSGNVLGFVDLAELYPSSERSSEEVLNGIAYDAASTRLFVTGKNWPKLYELDVGL